MSLQMDTFVHTLGDVIPECASVVRETLRLLVRQHSRNGDVWSNIKHDFLSKKFMETLIFILDHREENEAIDTHFMRMAKDVETQLPYLRKEDYKAIQDCFLQSVASFLKGKWTEQVSLEWEALTNRALAQYAVIADSSNPRASEPPLIEPALSFSSETIPLDILTMMEEKSVEVLKMPDDFDTEEKKETPLEVVAEKVSPTPSRSFGGSAYPALLSDRQQNQLDELAKVYAKAAIDKIWEKAFHSTLCEELQKLKKNF